MLFRSRTFIGQEGLRNHLASHVYDITYGSVRPGQDNLVVVDDSIVRGTTLRRSILRILARLDPKRIVIASTAPQIRYPDCYGIDMSKLGDFIAFRAAIGLWKDQGKEDQLDNLYRKCKEMQRTGTLQAAGDGMSISANACNDGDGTVIDGLMSLTLSRYTDRQNFAFSLSFTSFSATSTSGSDLVQLSGSLSAVYSGGNQTVIASSGLSAQARLAGQNRSVVVTGFSATIVDQGTQYTETLAGTFSLGALEGRSVVLSTVTPVVQRVDDLYPSSGALRLVGAGGSALLIEAVDATQARLSLDANGDGKFEVKESFGEGSVTGIALRNGYLYLGKMNSIERYRMTPGQLKPAGPVEVVVSGLEGERQHGDKGIAFDGKGSVYVNIGAPSNACQSPDRRPGAKGQDPCPLLDAHGGIWKFDENKLGQKQSDGVRYATGLRQMPAITWFDNALYVAMNNRDQLDVFWPQLFTAQENAERPAEPLYRVEQGNHFGWPYCFYDYGQKKLLLNLWQMNTVLVVISLIKKKKWIV